MKRQSGQNGYSLVEMLVVVAIIGLVSLVTVPNFMQYMRTAKLKNATRQFAIDLRETRQRAVTRYRPTKISFKAGSGLNEYYMADGAFNSATAGGIDWTKMDPNTEKPVTENQSFDETVYFDSTTLTDGADPDDWVDVVFLPNGKIFNGTNSSGGGVDLPTPATITIKSTDNIPKTTYLLELHSTGKIRMK